jgi:hypothetical protein
VKSIMQNDGVPLPIRLGRVFDEHECADRDTPDGAPEMAEPIDIGQKRDRDT